MNASGAWRVGVVVVLARVAERAGESLVPRVIEEGDDADDREGLPRSGVTGFDEVVLDADVDRRVVHVVLDAFAEHELQPDTSCLAGVEVRAEVEAPAGGVARQVELIVERRRPT